jgi:hypothetical protein
MDIASLRCSLGAGLSGDKPRSIEEPKRGLDARLLESCALASGRSDVLQGHEGAVVERVIVPPRALVR